jgi:hypothetical protein
MGRTGRLSRPDVVGIRGAVAMVDVSLNSMNPFSPHPCLVCGAETYGAWFCKAHYLVKEAAYGLHDLTHDLIPVGEHTHRSGWSVICLIPWRRITNRSSHGARRGFVI